MYFVAKKSNQRRKIRIKRVEIVLTATTELGCGATFGMMTLILLAAHTWTWNDIFSLQNSVIAHRLQTKYFSLSESNSCIIICC
jgi:hypothetical protein